MRIQGAIQNQWESIHGIFDNIKIGRIFKKS
ncbi:MAG: hypothetical protein RJA83_118 [Pseudomonadota bacterium]